MYQLIIRLSVANDLFDEEAIEIDMGNDKPEPVLPLMICGVDHLDPYSKGFLLGSVEHDPDDKNQYTGFIYAFGKTPEGFESAGCECAGVFPEKEDAEKATKALMQQIFVVTTPISFWAVMKIKETKE